MPRKIVQRAEDLGQPLQVAVEWRGGILGPGGRQMAGRKQDEGSEERLEHLTADMPPEYARGKV